MRLLSIVLCFGLLLISGVSCKKFDKKTQFELIIEDSFIIPSNVGINIPFVNFPTPPVNTNIDEELAIENKKKKKIESIILKELQFIIRTPITSTFSFINDIELSISADGLPEIAIAELHDIPFIVGKTLQLIVDSSEELEAYIKKDSVNLHVAVTTDETILQDVTVDLKAVFFVDVKVFNQAISIISY